MKTKKRFFLLAFCALIFVNVQTVNAQVTIGGEIPPVTGATLDLSPTGGYKGGLKLPSVELTTLTEIPTGAKGFTEGATATKSELVGTVVYNASGSLGTGMYMWDGTKWQAMFSAGAGSLLNSIYPVGSIYMSIDPTNPTDIFGGTWEAWGEGRVPVGVNTSDTDFSTVEKTDGAKIHAHTATVSNGAAATTGSTALTTAMLPSHTHAFSGTTATKSLTGALSQMAVQDATSGLTGTGVFTVNGKSGIVGYATVSKPLTASYNDYVSFDATHNHTFSGTTGATGSGSGHTHSVPAHTHTAAVATASTLQPYITCYMWKRTN